MSSENLNAPQKFILYKRRYFICLFVALTLFMNGELWISLAGITPQMETYFNVSSQYINWFSNIFLIILGIEAIPSVFFPEIFGLVGCILIAASCNVIGAAFRVLIIYLPSNNNNLKFGLCLFGNVFPAVAQGFILNLPTYVSFRWFGGKERDIYTSIMYLSNALGLGVGFVFAYSIVSTFSRFSNDVYPLRITFLTEFVLCLIILIGAIIAMREKPLTPPSKSQENTNLIIGQISKLQKIKKLLVEMFGLIRNWKTVCYLFSYACYYATSSMLSTFLIEIVYHYFPNPPSYVGFIGFSIVIVGSIFTLVFGIINSKYGPKLQKITGFICCAGCCLCCIVIIVVLSTKARKIEVLFFLLLVLGIFILPYNSIVNEQLADMTFPLEPQISTSGGLIVSNILGAIIIYGFGYIDASKKYVVSFSVSAILYFYCVLCIIFVKYTKNRRICDELKE